MPVFTVPVHEVNHCHGPGKGHPCEGNWKTQTISVQGRDWPLGAVEGGKLYHGSPHELEVGTVLTPGHARNFQQSSATHVSVTSDVNRAGYWASQTKKGRVFVYEIEPLDPVAAHRVGLANQGKNFVLWEGRTSRARITRRVK